MLARLEARGFRNLGPLVWEPGPGHHLVVGDNGAGKTGLLEAAYLLATTRSFRAARIAEAIRHGDAGFALAAEVEGVQRTRLEVDCSRGAEGGRRRAVNGRRGSLAEHLAVLPVVSWTAADGELLAGPPAARRRFLDRGVVAARPSAIDVLARCRQATTAKRHLLLRRGGDAPTGLEAWNAVLAGAAAELVGQRAAHVEALAGVFARLAAEALPAALTLRYRPSPPEALEGRAAIAAALDAALPRERLAARLLVGPQRDELEVRWDGHPVRAVASAGERKALGLLLVAAQAEVLATRRRAPLVLLDDADAELDRGRLEAVWRAFAGCEQLVATSSRPAAWSAVTGPGGLARRWRCAAGEVRAD